MNTQAIPKKQKGAALVIVMVLLASGLMIGVSGMNTSLVDERLAGNYRAASQAQMGAEKSASAGFENINKSNIVVSDFEDFDRSNVESMSWDDFIDNSNFSNDLSGDQCSGEVSCYYRYLEFNNNRYIIAMGALGDGVISVSEKIWVKVEYDGVGAFGIYSKTIFQSNAAMVLKGDVAAGIFDVNVHNSSDYKLYDPESFDDDLIPRVNRFDGYISSIDTSQDNVVVDCEPGSQFYEDVVDVIYCDGPVSMNKDSYNTSLEGKAIVSIGGISADMNTWPDSNISFISDGAIHLSSKGNKTIEGLVWASGDIDINARMNLKGLLWTESVGLSDDLGIRINSRFEFEQHEGVLDNIPGVVDFLNFPQGSDGGDPWGMVSWGN